MTIESPTRSCNSSRVATDRSAPNTESAPPNEHGSRSCAREAEIDAYRAIKAALDPNDVLNPNVLLPPKRATHCTDEAPQRSSLTAPRFRQDCALLLPHRPAAPCAGVVGSGRRLVGPPAAFRRPEHFVYWSASCSAETCVPCSSACPRERARVTASRTSASRLRGSGRTCAHGTALLGSCARACSLSRALTARLFASALPRVGYGGVST